MFFWGWEFKYKTMFLFLICLFLSFCEGCPGKAVNPCHSRMSSWIINDGECVYMTFLTTVKTVKKKIIIIRHRSDRSNSPTSDEQVLRWKFLRLFWNSVFGSNELKYNCYNLNNVDVVKLQRKCGFFLPFCAIWLVTLPHLISKMKKKKFIWDWHTEMGCVEPWLNICQNAQKK